MVDGINKPESKDTPKNIEDIFDFEKKQSTEGPPIAPDKKVEVQKEVGHEQLAEGEPQKDAVEDEQSRRQYAPPADGVAEVPVEKNETLIKIENILSEHLDELFLKMSPQQQMTFKQEGEVTANKIDVLLQQTKIKAREILSLLKEWLMLVPGINKFFLEQEAKIKTERLLNLRERKIK